LSDAIQLALTHNPDARGTAADVRGAHGALVQSRAFENPGLFVSSLGTQVNPLDWPRPNQIGLSWTLPIGGKRSAGIASAQAGLKAAEASRSRALQQLELDVAQAYVGVLLDTSLLEFARQDEADFQKTLALDELRYKDGQIAYGELLKLRLQALSIADAVRDAESALVQARADLVQRIGVKTLPVDVDLAGTLAPVAAEQSSAEALVKEALQNRPDIKGALAQTASAKEALTQQRRQPIPDLGLLADYNHGAGEPDSFDLQLSVSIPLLDQNSGNVEQAAAAYTKAQLAHESLELQIRSDAQKAVEELRVAQAQLTAYAKGVQAARESLDISRHAFQAGSGSLLDFLDAETRYREVEVSYRNAIARQAIAAYSLRFIAGRSLP
jgi:cobalt-zinc-cadmium efflux system outer membrane protein